MYSATTPWLVSSSSSLSRSSSCRLVSRSSSAVSSSWFWARSSSSGPTARPPASRSRRASREMIMGAEPAVVPFVMVMVARPDSWVVATSSISRIVVSRLTSRTASAGGPCQVISIASRGADVEVSAKLTVASVPLRTRSRPTSLRAVATRTWSCRSRPIALAASRPYCRITNTPDSADSVIRSSSFLPRRGVMAAACRRGRPRRRCGRRRRAPERRRSPAGCCRTGRSTGRGATSR